MPGAVGVGASEPVAWAGAISVEAERESVWEKAVEVAIGRPDAGEQALKNRPNAAEPMQASSIRKKSRREIVFNFHLRQDHSEKERTLHE